MGFGSYDESERENQEVDAGDAGVDDHGGVDTNSPGHDGAVDFEFTASNDELLARLARMKDES